MIADLYVVFDVTVVCVLFGNDRWNRSLNALPVPSIDRESVCVRSIFKPRPACAYGKSEVVLYRVREYTDRIEMNVCLPQREKSSKC
jgi:hypothetical protein